jgi:hypothetical protein
MRSRMTMRRYLVLIVLLGVLLAAGKIAWRWAEYRRLAAWHEAQAAPLIPPVDEGWREKAAAVAEQLTSETPRALSAEIPTLAEEWSQNPRRPRGGSVMRLPSNEQFLVEQASTAHETEIADQMARAAIQARDNEGRAQHHRERAKAYRDAESRPWRSVPDPPDDIPTN